MRNSLTFTSLLAVLFLNSAAFAQSSVADEVVSKLQDDGYTVTEIRRSWLGRIVITANDASDLREVVLNRTSGDILSDQTFPIERQSDGGSEPNANSPDPTIDNQDEKPAPNELSKPDGSGGKGGNDGGAGSGNGGGNHGNNAGGHGGNG